MSEDTRTRLLEAANRVVQERGLAKLTLSEVASQAGVSKGGLLYHFSTKESLIQAMLEHALGVFEAELERLRSAEGSAGAWLRAYIQASFPPVGSELHSQSMMIGSALLAGMANDPQLLRPYRDHLQRWVHAVESDGFDPALAQVLRLAVDGLWLHEALGLQPFSEAERSRLVESLLQMCRPALGPKDSNRTLARGGGRR